MTATEQDRATKSRLEELEAKARELIPGKTGEAEIFSCGFTKSR